MLTALLRAAACLPLAWFHALGALFGWAVYLASPLYAARLRANLVQSKLCQDDAEFRKQLRRSVAEAGKSVLELIPVWFRDEAHAAKLVIGSDHWELIEAAQRQGKGIIFLTPHLGCFEISALYAAQRLPITVLYRPPKLKWVETLMHAGRGRGNMTLAPTDLRGVRLLLKALKRGETVGLLPDQAPGVGEGEWADFFGRPAYTMTLAGRLQQASGAAVILAFAERLPRGRGYAIHLKPFSGIAEPAAMNAAVEEMIKLNPAQYLWSYNRYKVPSGAEAPPAEPMRTD